MLQSDALRRNESDSITSNLNSLDIDMISLIQKEIDHYDMISLVFLLYDVPDTALERLIIYQRVSKDVEDSDTNLLHDWALHVHHRPNWRQQFVEALVTCQLYSIIRKMGLDVAATKQKYQSTDGSNNLIHPLKKTLYRLCENMNADSLHKLKKTLITYDIDVTEHESCELLLLDLMCRRFITLKCVPSQKQTKSDPGIENIAKIIENYPQFVTIARDLRNIESEQCDKANLNSPGITSTPVMPVRVKPRTDNNTNCLQEFHEVFELFNELNISENEPAKAFKSDTLILNKDIYPIKNPKNVGVCLIINQEKFHPSKDSIENNVRVPAIPLEDRMGSTKDKDVLSQTMANLNFEVITRDNIDHQVMFETIMDVIKYRVREEHSMFMLCILSHGTKGHVYAADSVKVKVEDIESLLDSDEATHLRNKPKMLILEACQVEDDEPHIQVVADSPYKYYIKKSDMIIYWATAPKYEAFRHEQMGSIFIQVLCNKIQECANKDHINDIFIKVNYYVKNICVRLQRDQLPKVEHTLMKKLYLQIPEKIA